MSVYIDLDPEHALGIVRNPARGGFDWRITRKPGVAVQTGYSNSKEEAETAGRAAFTGRMAQEGYDEGGPLLEGKTQLTPLGVIADGEMDRVRESLADDDQTRQNTGHDKYATGEVDEFPHVAAGDAEAHKRVEGEVPEGAAADTNTDASKLRGKLADDFPGKDKLESAELTTYAKVRNAIKRDPEKWYSDVDGVGEATAAKIAEAVGVEQEGDDAE